jgi:hypothetical protein
MEAYTGAVFYAVPFLRQLFQSLVELIQIFGYCFSYGNGYNGIIRLIKKS